MATCSRCGCEFDLSFAKRSIGQRYGAGTYDNYYPDEEVCDSCAIEQIGTDFAAGEETLRLARMCGWDDED